jgi:hypothetical protein
MLKSVGPGKVAQYLAAKAAPVLAKGVGKLQKLREHEQTHDDSAEKRAQAEQAVVIPTSEGQAKSNTGQVSDVSSRPAPPTDENKAKQTLQESLRANVPRTIEDVDNFKSDQKGQHIGADVMTVVLADKNAVVSTYQDMGHTPAPAPREHEPESLPPTETAPATAALNLGKDAIAPLQKEHTDVSNFTKEADSKLKEEGVTQEQLDMVDSGDLATAKKEKKGMETAAKTEPIAVQQFARQQTESVDKDLKAHETKQRGEMTRKRKGDLAKTKNQQTDAKSKLEKKREEVASQINGIYTTAQDKVKKRLADLETESMKRFDEGNAKATRAFEDNVNREIDAFKEDRYSGWFGWARKVRDWIKGIDDLPSVKAIFDRNRAAFVTAIDRLVADISADNKRVIQECKDELQNARTKIADFVSKLGPALKDVGKKAADEMNSKLNEMDKFIAKKEEDLQNQLKDKQTAAIKAIDEKIEKMKEAMAGALAKLGKLLLWAAKKFFTWALQKFGYSLEEIEGIINKGAAVLKAIFTKPIQFVKNLMNAAITGFKNFGKNFLKHLKDALFEWLTGSLQGLVLPTTWDFQGIISVALQMIGISYQNIRKHLVTAIGSETAVVALEKTFTLVQTLVTKGPMAAWEQLKEMAAEMRDAFIDAVKDFIKQKIVEQAIQWLVSLFIPGAGIVKAIIGIYDTVVFFIQKAKQIAEMIGNFLGSMGDIAAGNIGAAADAMEKGLARGLSLVISFLAQLLHLSGVTKKIQDAIQKIKTKVDAVLAKVAKWIVDKAKMLIGKGVGAVKAGVAKVLQWWKISKEIRLAGGVTHLLFLKGDATNAVLTIRSEEMTYGRFLDFIESKPETSSTQKAAIAKARPLAKAADVIKAKDYGGTTEAEKEQKVAEKQKDLDKALEDLRKETVNIFGSDIPDSTQPFRADVYSGGGDEMGAEMEVKPLTFKLKEKGTPPTQAGHRVYNDINLRKNAAGSNASFYIRGHLLNQNLGGKGSWKNMTPLSRSGNSQHEGEVEAIVKRAVESGATVHYQIKANYASRSDKQGLKDAITSTDPNPAHVPLKHKIIDAEDHVPASLMANAFVITKQPDGAFKPVTTLISKKSVTNDIRRSASQYHVSGALPPIKVNLNARQLQEYLPLRRHGLTPAMAMKLVLNLQTREKAYGAYDVFKRENTHIPDGVLSAITDDPDVMLGNLGARINKFPS